MRAIDVLNNVRHNDYDISGYRLCKEEAEIVIQALSVLIANEGIDTRYCPVCGKEVK